jgi:hypothetical protein
MNENPNKSPAAEGPLLLRPRVIAIVLLFDAALGLGLVWLQWPPKAKLLVLVVSSGCMAMVVLAIVIYRLVRPYRPVNNAGD